MGEAMGLAEGKAMGEAMGRTDEARKVLKRLGSKRFGKPGSEIGAAIDNLNDLEKLEELTDRILDVQSWEELLGESRNGAGRPPLQ